MRIADLRILDRTLPSVTAPRPLSRCESVVIHTTGRGLTRVVLDALGAESATDAQDFGASANAAADWYERSGHAYFGHFLVGWSGAVVELRSETLQCLHAASLPSYYKRRGWAKLAKPMGQAHWRAHGRDPSVVFDWWIARWGMGMRAYGSPVDLPPGAHPNRTTVGIDMLPTERGVYTDAQLAALPALVAYVALRWQMPIERARVLGHADIDPCRRGVVRLAGPRGKVVGKDWDPGSGVDLGKVAEQATAIVAAES